MCKINLFETEIPVEYENECVRLEEAGTNMFKALCQSGIDVTVKYGDNVLLPDENGVYSLTDIISGAKLYVFTKGQSYGQCHLPDKGINDEDLTCYNSEVYGSNFWEGETVYHEPVMFASTPDGTVMLEKSLMYPIDDVISVRSCDFKKWYVKGVDFEITKDRKLKITENSKIPLLNSELRLIRSDSSMRDDPTVDKGTCSTVSDYYYIDEDYGLKCLNESFHEEHTVYVTYTHKNTWKDLNVDGFEPFAPKKQGKKLLYLYEKMKTGADINVLVYGDSTATGAASSGKAMEYVFFEKGERVIGNLEGINAKIPTFFCSGNPKNG